MYTVANSPTQFALQSVVTTPTVRLFTFSGYKASFILVIKYKSV